MGNSCFLLALAIFLLSRSSLCSAKTLFLDSTTDKNALVSFKGSINSDPHNILSQNWSTNSSMCYWIGVSCSIKHQRVTALNLSGFDLTGTLAPDLGNLTFLRYSDVSSNKLAASIPSHLSNLRRLKAMNIGANSFIGEIPSWLGRLPQLEQLYMYSNNFSGEIPGSLFNNSKLQILDMRFNQLDGNIPKEIGNSSSLGTLDFRGNRLTGSIPHGIFNVSSIVYIDLSDNSISGSLPNDMCANYNIKFLSVGGNQLEGQIPPNIRKCRDLEQLRLTNNNFSGTIPNEIASLSRLRRLNLRANKFQGSIPKEIGNLTFLEYLILDTNNLTGELPEEVGNLGFLEGFTVRTNVLHGSIPSSIFNISSLRILELSENQFSGSLPPTMGITLPNIQNLYLHTNSFSGAIPSSIANASKLSLLDISINSFSGFTPDLSNLQHLLSLSISINNLTSPKSPTQQLLFLTWLSNCKSLKQLDISYNPLHGILPSSVGNFSDSLQVFWARGCNITGAIPPEVGNLTGLLVMFWSENHFTGLIPPTIAQMKQLQVLYLRGSRLQGIIPRELCGMTNLGDLSLANNILTGPIPECLGKLQALRMLFLGSNNLNSTIPLGLWNLRDLVALDLSSNNLGGNLSSRIGGLKALSQVDLSFNHFSGSIPSFIDGCQSLELLSLSNNNFQGSIPQSLGNIRGLIILDLSNNNLSGSIPKSLQNLPFLLRFNVSYNSLEGEIPNLNFSAESFAHNSALCGAIGFGVPPCIVNERRSRSENAAIHLVNYILPPVVSAIILVILVCVCSRRRKSKQIPPAPVADDGVLAGISWRRVSRRELQLGTNDFSEDNMLGRGSFGSVFKGTLSHELNVAVKVFNLELEGALKSFETEGEILSSVRHRNLVRIIGCCSNIEFKALILAYMPNGNLDRWLYYNSNRLDFAQSLKVAVDVGSALEYLHHGHTFAVVHCDIKPSNVLLDEDMTARLGDFGIAKLFDEDEVMVQTKTLATVGYAAPEYGSEGKVSTKGDVYSYGIMLLEIFTRKKPTDEMFGEEMELKEWVSGAMQENRVSEVVAPILLSREDSHSSYSKEKSVLSIFDLAMKCLCVSPEERINAMQIVAALHKIKAEFLENVQQ